MTEEMKKAQEELATLQFSREDILTITGAQEIDELSYRRGQLLAQAEVRKSILSMAKQGSSPAQRQFLDLVTADARTQKEITAMEKWAKTGETDDYKAGTLATLNWIYHRKPSPKELY